VPADIFVAWCGFGLNAVSAAIENKHAFCKRSRRRTLHAN
jgi:hypothetical protein